MLVQVAQIAREKRNTFFKLLARNERHTADIFIYEYFPSALCMFVLRNQDIIDHTGLPQPIMTNVVANNIENHIELAHKLDRCQCTKNYGS
jgi:hypothetical protein